MRRAEINEIQIDEMERILTQKLKVYFPAGAHARFTDKKVPVSERFKRFMDHIENVNAHKDGQIDELRKAITRYVPGGWDKAAEGEDKTIKRVFVAQVPPKAMSLEEFNAIPEDQLEGTTDGRVRRKRR